MNRVRRTSTELLAKFRDEFTDNFEDNKNALSKIVRITSKQLRNEIAGTITKIIKREIAESEPEPDKGLSEPDKETK